MADEEVETGGGKEPDDFGLSPGVVYPGLEDLGIDDDDDDDEEEDDDDDDDD